MMGAMTVVLSMTTVNVAFPDIMGAFGIGRDKAQLLSSGYLAAMTAGMVSAAWFISIFGERLTSAIMMTIFIIGSMMSGISETEEALNFGRLMQGIAAGVIQPLTMAITFKVFPPNRRSTAMGLYSMGIVLAPAVGPTLGGIAIELFNWRYVFFLTLPTSALAVLLSFLFMPCKKIDRKIPKFDFFGFVLMCLSLFSLMLALSSGQREGWGSDYILILFAIGLTSGTAFVVWEHYAEVPLMNMRVFRFARFSSAAVVAFFSGCIFLTSTFLIPVFVQEIQGYTPLRAGYLLMPGGLSLLLFFPLAGRIADLVPAHIVIGTGLLSYIVAFTLQRRRREYAVLDFRLLDLLYPLRVGLHDAGGECDGLESGAGRNGQSSERYDQSDPATGSGLRHELRCFIHGDPDSISWRCVLRHAVERKFGQHGNVGHDPAASVGGGGLRSRSQCRCTPLFR